LHTILSLILDSRVIGKAKADSFPSFPFNALLILEFEVLVHRFVRFNRVCGGFCRFFKQFSIFFLFSAKKLEELVFINRITVDVAPNVGCFADFLFVLLSFENFNLPKAVFSCLPS